MITPPSKRLSYKTDTTTDLSISPQPIDKLKASQNSKIKVKRMGESPIKLEAKGNSHSIQILLEAAKIIEKTDITIKERP